MVPHAIEVKGQAKVSSPHELAVLHKILSVVKTLSLVWWSCKNQHHSCINWQSSKERRKDFKYQWRCLRKREKLLLLPVDV